MNTPEETQREHLRLFAGRSEDRGQHAGAYCDVCSEAAQEYVWPCLQLVAETIETAAAKLDECETKSYTQAVSMENNGMPVAGQVARQNANGFRLAAIQVRSLAASLEVDRV